MPQVPLEMGSILEVKNCLFNRFLMEERNISRKEYFPLQCGLRISFYVKILQNIGSELLEQAAPGIRSEYDFSVSARKIQTARLPVVTLIFMLYFYYRL